MDGTKLISNCAKADGITTVMEDGCKFINVSSEAGHKNFSVVGVQIGSHQCHGVGFGGPLDVEDS
jgi:hypothetical protein